MPRNTSVSLGDHFTGFIERKLEEGRYNSASEVIRAGLRLLEDNETRLERLRALIDEGEASGPGKEWDFDAFLAERHAQRRE